MSKCFACIGRVCSLGVGGKMQQTRRRNGMRDAESGFEVNSQNKELSSQQ